MFRATVSTAVETDISSSVKIGRGKPLVVPARYAIFETQAR